MTSSQLFYLVANIFTASGFLCDDLIGAFGCIALGIMNFIFAYLTADA